MDKQIISFNRDVGTFKSGTGKMGVWGSPAGIQGTEPLGGGEGEKPPEARAFSKMRLEFVQQVDGTISIITKVLIKSRSQKV